MLHRGNQLQRVERQVRIGRLVQDPRDRLPIVAQLIALPPHVEIAREHRIGSVLQVGRDRRDTLRQLQHRAHPKGLELGLGRSQTAARVVHLIAQDLGQLLELLPLQVRGDDHAAIGHPVHDVRDQHRISAAQADRDEGPVQIGAHVQVLAGDLDRSVEGLRDTLPSQAALVDRLAGNAEKSLVRALPVPQPELFRPFRIPRESAGRAVELEP